jgi:hypothetical protein
MILTGQKRVSKVNKKVYWWSKKKAGKFFPPFLCKPARTIFVKMPWGI